MTIEHVLPITTANVTLLNQELKAGCLSVEGLSSFEPFDGVNVYTAQLTDSATSGDLALCDSIAQAHDPQGQTAQETLKAQLKADAQAIVGLDWTALTNAQLKTLIGVLLYKVNAIQPDLTIAPLNQWDI